MSKPRNDECAEAKRRCRLTDEAVRLAKELGISPRSMIKNIPSPQQRWKAPVEEWVRSLHHERFGRRSSAPPKAKARATAVEAIAQEPPPNALNELEMAQEE